MDKVKALERAGVIVTPSPAKIGATMYQVKERERGIRLESICVF